LQHAWTGWTRLVSWELQANCGNERELVRAPLQLASGPLPRPRKRATEAQMTEWCRHRSREFLAARKHTTQHVSVAYLRKGIAKWGTPAAWFNDWARMLQGCSALSRGMTQTRVRAWIEEFQSVEHQCDLREAVRRREHARCERERLRQSCSGDSFRKL
jgi:hypothetical protein